MGEISGIFDRQMNPVPHVGRRFAGSGNDKAAAFRAAGIGHEGVEVGVVMEVDPPGEVRSGKRAVLNVGAVA